MAVWMEKKSKKKELASHCYWSAAPPNFWTVLWWSLGLVLSFWTDSVSPNPPGYYPPYHHKIRECKGRKLLNATRGVITDGPGKYPMETHCEWLIDAQSPRKSITLTFEKMNTECSYDILFVYDGNSYNSMLLGSFSGDIVPDPVTAFSGYMLIHLYSDNNHVLDGFNATYVITDCPYNCSGQGVCKNHTCICNFWYTGIGCEKRLCSTDSCKGHGKCKQKERCICEQGYVGSYCDLRLDDSRRDPGDTGEGRWYTLSKSSDIFTPRTGHTGLFITASNALWIFGGFTLNKILDDLVFYSFNTNQWQIADRKKSWPSARYGHAGVEFEDSFYIYGGVTSSKVFSDELWMYNTTSQKWFQKAVKSTLVPYCLTSHTLTRVDNWLYLFGGLRMNGLFSSDIFKIDTNVGQWELVKVRSGRTFMRRLAGHTTIFHRESKSLLVFGGFWMESAFASRRTNNLHAFHLEERFWSKIAYPINNYVWKKFYPHVIAHHSAVQMGNYMVIFGGNSHVHNEWKICYDWQLYLYNMGCHIWVNREAVENIRGDSRGSIMPKGGRFGHSAAVAHGNILLIAGGYAGHVLGDLIAYKVPKMIATAVPEPEVDRCDDVRIEECEVNPECLMCTRKDKKRKGCVHYNKRKLLCTESKPSHQCGSICELLRSCGECLIQGQGPTLTNSSLLNVVHNEECLWCVKEDQCQTRSDPQNTCLMVNGTKSGLVGWWAGLSASLTNVSQCREEDKPAGLHWLKYQNPMNITYPDQAEIIRQTVSRLEFESTLAKEVDQQGFYTAHYTGFIYPLQFPPPHGNKSLVLTVGTATAEITLYLSKDERKENKERVTGSGHKYEKSMAYEARRYGDAMLFRNTSRGAKYYVDLEAHLNITTSQNSVTELKSSVDITWNNVPQKKNSLKNEVNEQALTYEFLEPYHESKCKQNYNCLGCLSDNACGWCVETRTCILRDRNATEEESVLEGILQKVVTPTVDKCSGDMKSHLLITNMAECPVCTDYVSCVECANDNLCEWVTDDAHCIRRGRVEEAVKNPRKCNLPCYVRTTCSECTSKRDECAWCENTRQCLNFAQYVPLHLYGQCQHWVYSKLQNIQCHNCSRHFNYSTCLDNFGCGWCYNEHNPTIGVCLDGDFVGPAYQMTCAAVVRERHNISVEEPAHWAYGVAPDVDECALSLHKCHPNATCYNTFNSYICECNRGFIGINGTKQCEKTCYYDCVNGKCSGAPDYECRCHIGWTGAECNTSCGCNGHSACPKGIGVCEECLHNTMGQFCEMCRPGSYGDPTSGEVCKLCKCNGHGDLALDECHNQSGKCFCKDDTKGFHCQHCLEDYYGNPKNGGRCYRRCGAATVLTNVTSGALGSFETTPELNHSHQIYCLWIITPFQDVQTPYELAREKKTLPSISFTFEPDISVNCSTDDFIYVYDGIPDFVNGSSKNYGLLLGAFCGNHSGPLGVEATMGVLTVYFVTYEKDDPIRQGFNAVYSINWCPAHCTGNRTCDGDRCVCKDGYLGPNCDMHLCPLNCSKSKGNPKCNDCVCPDGHRCHDDESLFAEYLFNPETRLEGSYPLHLARMGHSLISCGDDVLYLYGGRSLKYGLVREMWMFNLTSSEWSKVIASTDEEPSGRYHHAAVCVPILKTIFVYGGIVQIGRNPDKYQATNEFWKFAIESRKWTKEKSDWWLPTVAGHTLTYVQDIKLVVIGGFSTEKYFLDKVLIYDSAETSWEMYHRKNLSGIIPLGIYGHSAVYHRAVATIYIFGGMLFTKYYKFAPSKELYTFDPDNLQWNILQASDNSMLEPRMFHVAVNTVDYMLLIGGWTVDRKATNYILLYRFKCNTWQNITFKDSQINLYLRSYFGAAAATVNKHFYIMGGFSGVESAKLLKIGIPDDTCKLIDDYEMCKRTVECSACKVKISDVALTFCILPNNMFPEICVSGNISKGRVCDKDWFLERDCNQYHTCDQCLAIYPEFKNTPKVCKWCKHCKVGKCIRYNQKCGEENPCNRTQEEFRDMTKCDGIICNAVNCHSCHDSKKCMWTRQVIRTGEMTRILSGNPQYSWSCVIKGIQRGDHSDREYNSRQCPTQCYRNQTCEKCVSSHGAEGGSQHCVWSEKLKECIPPAYIPLHCSAGECGSLFREYNHCPVRCMEIQQCSRCISTPSCGWCSFGAQLDGRGLCMPGGLSGTSNGLCSETNITYGSTHLSEKIQDQYPNQALKISWVFVKCPPEDECKNSHHTCDSTTEQCVDTPESFKCICKPGYRKRGHICEPVCNQGCVHGKCTSPDQCKCMFGWVGNNCSVQCDCNNHSECKSEKHTKICTECLHNTQGPQCQECRPLFVGDPRNGGHCQSCFEYCNNHTKICINTKESGPQSMKEPYESFMGRGPKTTEAVCKKCENNTEGPRCERCKMGYFRLSEDKPYNACRPCMCNGHAFDCKETTGMQCNCKNNTETKCDKDEENCYKNQCSSCKDSFLGESTDGHQCYSRMEVDVDYCFNPEHHIDCGVSADPLLQGRTVFYAVQPKYLNVNIRITIDITQGGVDVYFSPNDKTFVVDLNRETWFHEVKLDKNFKAHGNHGQYTQYQFNNVYYYLRKEVASDTNKFITLEQVNTTLNVSDVRFLLVITLPLDVHNLEKSQFYMIIYGRGDAYSNQTYGKLFFRQDQPHIDLFVFFSVFFSCFFLFLAFCVLIWKIKQTVDTQRSRQQRAREMQHMASRPFAGVLVLVDHEAAMSNPTPRKIRVNKPTARSPQLPEVNMIHPYVRDEHFSILPIAIEPTENGIASVATVVFQLPGGGSTTSKLCLGSALTLRQGCGAPRMAMRRRPSSSMA